MSKKRILSIDDEINFSKLLKRNLELIGDFEVFIAGDGQQGLDLARRLKPDLILLDIMMPVVDGFKVLDELKQEGATAPVIMLSAKGDDPATVGRVRAYGREYMSKPVEADDLRVKIEQVLGKSRDKST